LSDPLSTLDQLEDEAPDQLDDCEDLGQLEDFRVEYLGRNGKIRDILSSMDEVPEEKRPTVGKRANQLKQSLENRFENKKESLKSDVNQQKRADEWLDVTLPGRHPGAGHTHPISQVLSDINQIFENMGFKSVQGPEIETDWYNFEALNIPEDHPARDMHDTFYLDDGRLLRTHTSPVQIHTMENEEPPLRMVAPGRVYRRDDDPTHSPMFHQVEGLWVDESVTFSELKGTLDLFVNRFFEDDVQIRFRPSYFPFTEPSAEVDIAFDTDQSDEPVWLEILGAGMVDPAVFEAVDYDTDRYQGFAFGMGVERLAMLKHGIDNMQLLFDNDSRFLDQF